MTGAVLTRSLPERARLRARLLFQSAGYELRKHMQFRVGFLVREVLNGTVEPLCMLFVYTAIYKSAGAGDGSLRGWSYDEILRYIAGLLVMKKILFDNRALQIASEIFEGRITKYLVMPFPYFVLIQGRFLQYTLMQLGVASVVWCIGYGIAGDAWLVPVSWTAAMQAVTLALIGSYCCFLLYVILNTLAFWLDVVWSLLVLSWFVVAFTGGATIPVSQMPAFLSGVFMKMFPYWTISAPIEVLMGRLGTPDFLRGLGILAVWLVVLETARRVTWRRGLAKYVGAGM